MFSSNKMNRFLSLVLVTLVFLLSSCSERSEYGKKSDYEKLGAACIPTDDVTAPTVSSKRPTDNSTYNSSATTVAVTFSEKMASGSVTTNTSDTTCSGSFQLSSDNFTTCIKMSAAPVASGNDTIFTITPASSLSATTTFKVKITTSVTDISCNTLGSYNSSIIGFSTSPSGSATIKGSVKLDNGSALNSVSVALSIYGTTVATATSDSNGDFSQSSLGLGVYTLTYTKTNYLTASQSDTLESDNQTLTVETLTQLQDNCSSGAISGKITDAVDGSVVSSVGLYAYKGGTYITSTTTNSSGVYSFSNMAPAWYDVYSIKSGYIDENFRAYSCGAQANQDNSISTSIASGVMRIILKWPMTDPLITKDLDSYLYSPDNASTGWDKLFYNRDILTYDAGTVKLDKDAQTAPGDETVTISKVRSGTYKFRVHNYTGGSDNLSNSKAKVKVYYNDGTSSTKKKYYVPNDDGTRWDVFTFNKDNTPSFIASDNVSTANP